MGGFEGGSDSSVGERGAELAPEVNDIAGLSGRRWPMMGGLPSGYEGVPTRGPKEESSLLRPDAEEACGIEGRTSSNSMFSACTISLSCTDTGLASGSSCRESWTLRDRRDGKDSFLRNEAVRLTPAGLEDVPWVSLVCDATVSIEP